MSYTNNLNLFDALFEQPINILPKDGIVDYYGTLLTHTEADRYFLHLFNNIQWQNDQAIILGKIITTKRKVAWYGDKTFSYSYSNTTKYALPWTNELLALKGIIEKISGEKFNSCLLNLYHSGAEGMTWHSDDEDTLKTNGAIASLSLGSERKFAFKHKQNKEVVSLILQHGSLLVMKSTTQSNWLHRLPPTAKINDARINLTFRSIV